MMNKKKWNIVYYESEDGDRPFEDFVDSLKPNEQAKVFSWLGLLEDQGPTLPRPYADILEDGIHELRIKLSGQQIRGLYFFCYKDFIIMTHTFVKTTKKVPVSEISQTQKYREDFLKRFKEEDLRRLFDENV